MMKFVEQPMYNHQVVYKSMIIKVIAFIGFWIIILALGHNAIAQSYPCHIDDKAFLPGERVTYAVYYHWGFFWLNAGEVTFMVDTANFNGEPCFNFKGIGRTHKNYDWIFKVRDRYESFADTATLKPYHYIRDTHEGSYLTYNDNYFYHDQNMIISNHSGSKKRAPVDTTEITECTLDVLTQVYAARCIDYSKYQRNDTIPINMFLDSKVYSLYIRYLGKEQITSDFGTYNCIKFSPALIAGTIFKEGDEMTVWVTDDGNKIPMLVESPIIVGAVQAKLMRYEGLKYPVSSFVEE